MSRRYFMKKLFSFFICLVCLGSITSFLGAQSAATSTTAQDIANKNVDLTSGVQKVQSKIDTSQIPTGKWYDAKWDAMWQIENGGNFKLYKAGELVFDFSDKAQDMKINGSLSSGVTVSFKCEETQLSYSFRKDVSLSTDLELIVDNKSTGEHYVTKIKFQK